MGLFKDLTGQKFNMLTAESIYERNGGNVIWLWRCDCGGSLTAPGHRVTCGNTKSCGCKKIAVASARFKTHGLARTPEYTTWCNMIARCEKTNRPDFKHYGGRGVCVCERWRLSFSNFLDDMGKRPFPRASLDRIDVDGNYEPGNCRWVSQKRQTRNKKNNHLITHNGKTQTIADWADETGVPQRMIWDRIVSLGWTVEEALNPERKTKWNRRKPHTHSTV